MRDDTLTLSDRPETGTALHVVTDTAAAPAISRRIPTADAQLAPRILVAVAEDSDRQRIADTLRRHGFFVSGTTRVDAALVLAESFEPDVTLVDLQLWTPQGGTLFRELRSYPDTYLVAFAAADASAIRVNALRSGADDVVTTSTSAEEIAARCHAMLRRPRRRRWDPARESVLRHGPLSLDLGRRVVRVHGHDIGATPFEFALLEALSAAPLRVLTREQLLRAGGGNRGQADAHTINVHVSNLRKKIRTVASELNVIEAVRGIGFRLSPDIVPVERPRPC